VALAPRCSTTRRTRAAAEWNPAAGPPPHFEGPVNPFGIGGLPFGQVTPALADIDGDGDLDCFLLQYGSISFFQNTGTAEDPAFATPSTYPFGLTGRIYDVAITFADIDDDGDLDSFVSNDDLPTTLRFFENTGTAQSPAFAAPASNPFGLAPPFGHASLSLAPAFADIDGDGDLDAFIGASGVTHGYTLFFRNTGTAQSPAFANPFANLFGLVTPGYSVFPQLVDIDGDGDLDAFLAVYVAGVSPIFFFRNTGSAQSPAFGPSSTDPSGYATSDSLQGPRSRTSTGTATSTPWWPTWAAQSSSSPTRAPPRAPLSTGRTSIHSGSPLCPIPRPRAS